MITITGWPSYQAWVDAGCPGAVSFDAQGNRKGTHDYAAAFVKRYCECGVEVQTEHDQCWDHRTCAVEGCERRLSAGDFCYLHRYQESAV